MSTQKSLVVSLNETNEGDVKNKLLKGGVYERTGGARLREGEIREAGGVVF